jgi:hypothetical protein
MSTIPQSTTPRTDAAVRLTIGAGFNMVYPSFARELENELAHLRAEVERLKGMASWAHTCIHHNDAERAGAACPCCAITRAEKAERELAAAKKRIADCEFVMAHRYDIIERQEPRCNEANARDEKAEAEAKQLINTGVNN